MVPWYWSSQPWLMFESDENGSSDVFGWSSDSWPGFSNLSDDPESDDRNPGAAFCPIITLRKGDARAWMTLEVSVFERRAQGDSSLVFWPGDYRGSDTVRSEGHNRDVTISPGFFPAGDGYFYYPVTWESNRTGRQHLYGAFVQSLFADVDAPVTQPEEFTLEQNYPNPFNGETLISLRMPVTGSGTGYGRSRVSIRIYDLLGRLVSSVYDGPLGPGPHTFPWRPRGLATGTYICRVSAAGAIRHVRILYVR